MRAKTLICLGCLLCVIAVATVKAQAGGSKIRYTPPIDVAMMGFKNHGVWYFLCHAPAFPVRIAPHYLEFGPPPPCVSPMMAAKATQFGPAVFNGQIPTLLPPTQSEAIDYGSQTMR